MRRFFVAENLLNQAQITLPKEVAHHIKTVLRLPLGAEILLCDGRGHCCHCRVDQLSSNSGCAAVLNHWFDEETALRIELIQGLPSGDKFDLILQKNTELGVTLFQPVTTERSQFSLPANKLAKKMQRWQRIVCEAARQSERAWLPKVSDPLPVAGALSQCGAEVKLVLWEEARQPLNAVLPPSAPQSVAVLVGSEGGLSPAEVDGAMAHGFVPVSLGPRILRTETAGMAIAAILQFHYGDLDQLPKRNYQG
ncbi:MAG: 16S rRNA (uracil(1498)-N(3))-methyltransferase [Thermodesulfobacteriota bacterium]|nr:16S rRNA (uracil(1498)-N(3))-methyltransferase [Thermodesulfobacteriota bacterium]